jgi:hypothetical protein
MRRLIPFAAGLLCAGAVTLRASPVRADEPSAKAVPVYVLALWTDDADDQAEALTRALRWRATHAPGWSLLETNQSFETLAIALKCPPKPDAACLQRIGDQLKADHYIWGTMDKRKGAGGELNASLHLWTRGKAGADARKAFPDPLGDPSADESLRTVAADLFGQLTAVSTAPSGPSNAALRPERPEEPIAGAAPADVPKERSDQGFTARTALAYSTLAAGVGFMAASAVEAANWLSDKNTSTDDRKLVPASVTDVCAEPLNPAAVDACNKSRDAVNASTLGWIFGGAGLALVATGVILLTTEHASKEGGGPETSRAASPRLLLSPSVGPRAGALHVRVTF